jgi:hypothetical protein
VNPYRRLAAILALTLGCPAEQADDDATFSAGLDSAGVSTTGGIDETGDDGTSGGADDEAPSDSSGDPDGTSDGGESANFVGGSEGGAMVECDLWTQDCPAGEKCMPWANDGGGSWNAAKCTPLDPAPQQPGDDCMVEGNDVSGNDNCALGSMCFSVDPETNVGTCVPFCSGSEANPTCDDAMQVCNISNDGVLILCLNTCDPLLQDCPTGAHQVQGCYPVNEDFLCWPDFSFDMGAYADPCEFFNVCDPGLFCAVVEFVPGCAGASGCCSEFCEVGAMNDCSGAAGGQECIAWFAEGAAPPGQELIGVCGLP